MADVIKKSTNKFTKGLVMDFSPENTRNEVLTHALNATLLTFNGNELSLQNDMGNARVETAYLPEGYIPVGTCEYGGIIYIVSYNPLEDKSQIGCFPSPERTISNDELGKEDAVLTKDFFQELVQELNNAPSGKIKNNSQYVLLKEDHLNPGDKFLICSDGSIFNEKLVDLYKKEEGNLKPIDNPILALNVVSIEDSGKIVYLNSDLRQYEVTKNDNVFSYHILGQDALSDSGFNQASVDIDSYRNAVSSGYNVFKSKTSGRLALLAELVMIDSYSVTHSLLPTRDSEGNVIPGNFDVLIHTEVTPNLTESNFAIAPKLSYYYLQNSQGYLQRAAGDSGSGEVAQLPLFTKPNGESSWAFNEEFLNTTLNSVYDPVPEEFKDEKVSNSGNFGFYFPDTYSGKMLPGSLDSSENKYVKVLAKHYYRIDNSQKDYVVSLKSNLYIYNDAESRYTSVNAGYEGKQLFFEPYQDLYLDFEAFKPDTRYNYIEGYNIPTPLYEGESAMSICYLSEFIPQQNENNITQYEDFKLGHITLPKFAIDNELDFPFKYEYTLVPCMNYGKLEHLAVSNTVDFSQLHAFNNSEFNTWKYHIDGNQLRLTFGAEIFDAYEDDKVDGLILEFYDLWGFAGSLEITDKKSYSGVFTKILSLNSPNTLSNKHIVNSEYSTAYKHNIGIAAGIDENEGKRFLEGREISWDPVEGWYYAIDEDGNKEGVANDCGTLYPNIIYGIKTYLRQSNADGSYKFTRKKDLFLFTVPIYNDFYYTVNDFSTLGNPTLDLMLTYKLTDSSNVIPYVSDLVTDGFANTTDYPVVSEYLKGQYQGTSLSGTCYYKYVGTSNLCLEIGLKQEYQQYGLSCSSDINNIFSCTLQLTGNNDGDGTFSIKSDLGASALNYKEESGLTRQSNKLLFDGNSAIKTIEVGEFQNYNFINNPTLQTIPINYEFVIGCNFKVNDLRETQVQSTTVCALLHKNALNQYNYEDFGIYEQIENEQTKYFSNALVYNTGTMYAYKFGVCKQVATDESEGIETMTDECRVVKEIIRENPPCVYKAGLLNTGNDLSSIIPFIGKLTFCQPHAHGMSSEEGVNIYLHDGKLRIAPWDNWKFSNRGWSTETEWGNAAGGVPSTSLYLNPVYNLSLNTLNSINLQSEFISTIDYAVSKGYSYNWGAEYKYNREHGYVTSSSQYNMREYTGFSGHQLTTFNKKLLKTMESVYAYNPDYDSFSIRKGDVQVENTVTQFNSNLITSSASCTFPNNKTFNDYIYLHSINLSSYFKLMLTYSDSPSTLAIKTLDSNRKFIPQIQFTPNCACCGNISYLITSLTYNTPTPKVLDSVLNFDFNNDLVIKHCDGSTSRLTGIIDKNALYGFDRPTNRLVQLDVTNYQILPDGSLQLKQDVISEYATDSVISVVPLVNYSYVDEESKRYMVQPEYSTAQIRGTSLTLNDLRYRPNLDHRLFVRNNCWKSEESPNNLLMYRHTSSKYTWTTAKSDNTSDNRYYNSLYLLTGPCFTLDNL